ncbi:MAG TPA: CBS domain-containing protein [Candidatus Saccharicenans sp.]|jgi:CBS domain-containing protein|nr:CBS domain-containing protein [Candidatus Saccharicenans sp.]HOM93514.1 CBS domain-containing protein [Candidatus Saccharicenans sp.]HPC87518.1 CBS domain-containing protein [Candidatus Saccharicenans sp.]HRT25151.1 CBS domain-containing protein [Candidatus Saccharicenans sp.]HRV05604.1 CBS domain-containing protein [Candidatus Saccharicenans sp.]
MVTVKQMLEEKGSEVWTISPEATVYEALKIMADKDIGALIVVENDQVVGIISERDYARKVMLRGKSSLDTPVKDIMSTEIYYVEPEVSAEECMALMTEKRIRHLPVMENGKLIGVISIGDAVKSIISTQKVTIEHLQNYIMGKYQ